MSDTDPGEERRKLAFSLNNEAAAFLQEGRPEKALPLLHQALDVLPDDTSVLLNLGGAYILLGRHEEAVAVLTRAADLAPDDAMVWCNLGAALLRLPGEREEEDQRRAIEALARALELDPQAANVAYNLGLVYRDRQEWQRAAHYFRRALLANPRDRDAASLLRRVEACLEEEMRRVVEPEDEPADDSDGNGASLC